ncbi:hypothetical protein DNTS_027598 [Danionella cerebrum]|uniref:5'-3' exonuclease PLD3 n=1 Tax=Danionella cerebrum TaxID=2873325 RepID=A0A553QW86_9TELE|nr:hypothetical protein DNTS_027598 [Danionella translucida]
MKSVTQYEKLGDVEMSRGDGHLGSQKNYRGLIILTFVSITLLILLLLQTLLVSITTSSSKSSGEQEYYPMRETCTDPCRIMLVESIPEGMVFNSSSIHQSTYEAWLNLISTAKTSLDIASFYWTLTNKDTKTHDATANQGERILQELGQLSGRVHVRIAVDKPTKSKSLDDINFLSASGADVRLVNMLELTRGVLHTKFWIVDKKHVYIGSANMDWRALTQVKELGAVVYDCSCLAADLGKIFEAYWYLNQTDTVPVHWPSSFSTAYNKETPMQLSLNGSSSSVYLSSSPPSLCADGRTADLQSILSVIGDAQEFVYIAVMNYLPTMEFSRQTRYWMDIDSQLRRVAYERKVNIRLLISCWDSTNPIMFSFLRSLASLQEKNTLDVQVRIFTVPSDPRQKAIPFARVNHNKYMVTDRVAYIAGCGLVVNQTGHQSSSSTVQSQLQSVFERDWDSPYSTDINLRTNRKTVC